MLPAGQACPWPVAQQMAAKLTRTLPQTLPAALQMAAKLVGLGGRRYMADRMNLFDAAIVFTAVVETVLSPPPLLRRALELPHPQGGGGGGLTALRTLRLMRCGKLLGKIQSLRRLLHTVPGAVREREGGHWSFAAHGTGRR